MKPRALSEEAEAELRCLIEQRRALSNEKLMARFGVSLAVIRRIASSVPRESTKKVLIGNCVKSAQIISLDDHRRSA